MSSKTAWTGQSACALQHALRFTNESFADHLGIGLRTVSSWHQRPEVNPRPEMQQVLDTALRQASADVQERFAQRLELSARVSDDPHIQSALDWLDQQSGWEPGTARARVIERLGDLDAQELRDRGARRRRIDRGHVAQALADYYGQAPREYGRYAAAHSGNGSVVTSILTRADWLDLACPLTTVNDGLAPTSASGDHAPALWPLAADQAVRRLAETLITGTRLVDMPIYQLRNADMRRGFVGGTVGVGRFVEYALTVDLLEAELVDALAAGKHPRRGELPLRDAYLPDFDAVLNLSDRMCAGGALALCAIARPASAAPRGADYLLLVQERSGNVLNAARQLAVIPKAFHQPLTDLRADAQVGRTLHREMEEELFGREEIDSTFGPQRSIDPLHPSRQSEPMRWLTDHPDRMRMECTGFGLNLVSGNYEFPSLTTIDDEEFWERFGGAIAANWEARSIRQYSSRDHKMLGELISDVAWSNEGLFALLQGLRRLAQIGGDRVNLPTITSEVLT